FWDLTFLSRLLDLLAADARQHVVDRLGLCVHNYASNLPLDWGKGGPGRWPDVHPYNTPSGSQDHRGFWLFEWYDAIVREKLGQSLPIVCGETGLIPGTQNHPSYPRIDEATHSDRSLEIARLVMDGAVPSYFFNTAFWTLKAGDADPVDLHAWYKNDGTHLPAVDAFKAMDTHPRSVASAPVAEVDAPLRLDPVAPDDTEEAVELPASLPIKAIVAPTDSKKRPIYHYVLFNNGTEPQGGISTWTPRAMISGIAEYVDFFRPTIGFSLDEAREARFVTVVGSDTPSLLRIEARLRRDGCRVERINASTERDAKDAFAELVRRRRRFFHIDEEDRSLSSVAD
ncbi:MAG: hypothetical protein ACYDAK_14050, partial [Candidatus Limnocylindrales bacterium]